MRCDQCKYWEKELNSNEGVKEIRECFKAKPLWDCCNWEEPDFKRVLKPEFKDFKLFVQDGSDYHAAMLTKADFFCAHFEKETDNGT